ncbi:hypothetical protein [Cloacibacterium caeni]|uniref:hypothetical protein n=1 Tax=Cloacibacterium caeni TaxID=2004710 RepID=UPI001BCB8A3B|nr:hypothetical protein [Cloacibacterium caeni]
MLKKFTFWLIPLLAIILQACAVDSVTTYHQDKTTSVLMNIDMKDLLAMAKNMGGDSANSDNKFKDFEMYPRDWKNMYEIMKEDSEKKGIAMTKDKDSIQLIKKMFVKSNFENNEMTGIAFKMDRLTPEEIKNFSRTSKKSNFISATSSDNTIWDGKTLTLDTEYFNPQTFSETLKKEMTLEAKTDSAKAEAESALAMMKMFNTKFNNKIKFETKIKSIQGKYDWVKKIDDYTIDMSFSFEQLLDESLKLNEKDKKVIIITE